MSLNLVHFCETNCWKTNDLCIYIYIYMYVYVCVLEPHICGQQDAGFRFAFDTMRVKFKPTGADMQVAEESGTDIAQAVLRALKKREKQNAAGQSRTGMSKTNSLPVRVLRIRHRSIGTAEDIQKVR